MNIGLTQKLSETLISLCPLRPLRFVFCCNGTEETSDSHFLSNVFLDWVSIAESLLYPGSFVVSVAGDATLTDCLQIAKASFEYRIQCGVLVALKCLLVKSPATLAE
ncbi:hypothetical protein H6H01_33220 [Nostoc calcicola FACHB-3891]|nr:hypothetical protein [Nostoc calcicola FACHB-3891]